MTKEEKEESRTRQTTRKVLRKVGNWFSEHWGPLIGIGAGVGVGVGTIVIGLRRGWIQRIDSWPPA